MIWNTFEKDFVDGKIDPYNFYDFPDVKPDPPGTFTSRGRYEVPLGMGKEIIFYRNGDGLIYLQEIINAIQENDEKNKDRSAMYRYARAMECYVNTAALTFNPDNWFGFGICGYYPGRRLAPVTDLALENSLHKKYIEGTEIQKISNELTLNGDITVAYKWVFTDYNWTKFFELGFNGLKERADKYRIEKEKFEPLDSKTTEFYESIDIGFNAILKLLDRYIALTDNSKNEKIVMMNNALKNLRCKPPCTLYEGLLFDYLFYYVGKNIEGIIPGGMGYLDSLCGSLYANDLKEGRLTREQAKELVKYFLLTWTYQRHGLGLPMGLGGSLANGQTAVNELTYIFLEAYDECNLLSPKMHILVSKNTPDQLLKKCADMYRRGHNSMVILNEEHLKEVWKKHFNVQDLEKHPVRSMGCFQLANEDMVSCPLFTRINLPKVIDRLFEDETVLAGIICFDDFKEAFLGKIKKLVNDCIKISEFNDSIVDGFSTGVIPSGTTEEALKQAKHYRAGGKKYNNTVIFIACPTTVFDSLIMVKKYVFDNKVVSLSGLKKALDADWVGYDDLHKSILADKDKFGNNIDWVDTISADIFSRIVNSTDNRKNRWGGKYNISIETIDWDVQFAKYVKATPDGRKAGEILSKGIVANRGQDRNGITAHIQSVSKLPLTDCIYSSPFEFVLHPTSVMGEDGLNSFVAMIRTCFELGAEGFEGNIIDVETMRKAQLEPEKFKTLQVRVCGWNLYFNDILKEQQEALIRQATVA